MGKYLFFLFLFAINLNTQAAVVLNNINAAANYDWSLAIPEIYNGFSGTFIATSLSQGDAANLVSTLYHPSGSAITFQAANPGDNTYTSTSIVYHGILATGNYRLYTTGVSPLNRAFICVVWDAEGDDVKNLRIELQAALADLKNELTAATNTQTANLQAQIDALKAQLDAADTTALQAQIDALTTALNEYKTKVSQDFDAVNTTLNDLDAAINSRMRHLEKRITYSALTDEALATAYSNKQTEIESKEKEILALDVLIQSKTSAGLDTSLDEATRVAKLYELSELQLDQSDIQFGIDLRKDSELAVHEAEINDLKAQLAALRTATETKLAELIENDTNNDTALADLQKQIQSNYSVLSDAINGLSGSGVSSSSNTASQLPSMQSQTTPTENRDLRTSPTTTLDLNASR